MLDVVLAPGFLDAVRKTSLLFKQRLAEIKDRFPSVIAEVRGEGLLLGLRCVVPNSQLVDALRDEHLLAVAAGDNVVRLVPPLIVSEAEVGEAMGMLERACARLARVERPGVQRQQFVHALAVLLGQLADAPHQPTPRFEVVFLSVVLIEYPRQGLWTMGLVAALITVVEVRSNSRDILLISLDTLRDYLFVTDAAAMVAHALGLLEDQWLCFTYLGAGRHERRHDGGAAR